MRLHERVLLDHLQDKFGYRTLDEVNEIVTSVAQSLENTELQSHHRAGLQKELRQYSQLAWLLVRECDSISGGDPHLVWVDFVICFDAKDYVPCSNADFNTWVRRKADHHVPDITVKLSCYCASYMDQHERAEFAKIAFEEHQDVPFGSYMKVVELEVTA